MTAKIWSKQLLMIRPDPSPYLMASSRTRLNASATSAIYYTTTPQIVIDTISNSIIGTKPYSIAYQFHKRLLQEGSYYILRIPGLVDFYTNNGSLYVLLLWNNATMRIGDEVLSEDINTVLFEQNSGIVRLHINSYTYTILDTTVSYEVLNYTNNNCTIDGNVVRGSTNNGYIATVDTPNFNTVDTWNIQMRYTHTGSNTVAYPGLFGPLTESPRYCPELAIQNSNNQLYVSLSSNGSSVDIGGGVVYLDVYLIHNHTYDFDMYFDGSKYALKVSEDNGATYQEYVIAETNTKVYGTDSATLIFLNTRAIQGGRYNVGTTYIDNIHVYANDVEYSMHTIRPYTLPYINNGKLWCNQSVNLKNVYAIIGE